MKKILRFIILSTVLTLISCGADKQSQNYSAFSSEDEAKASGGRAPEKEEVATTDKDINIDNSTVERKIIKEGDLRFETSNRAESLKLILGIAKECNAYVSKDELYNYNESIEQHITLRIPADKFDYLLEKIASTALSVDSKNITALDVTEEFVDIESRLKTKKELESKYKELLSVAKSVNDMLQIEREIGTLRTDIEAIEGRLRYLKSKVSYSTLSIVFYEKSAASNGFGSKIGHSLMNGWTNFLWFIVGLFDIWPFLVLSIALVIFLRKRRRKRKLEQTK